MPLIRFPTPTGLVYTIDLSKISDRENPRTVEAPFKLNVYPDPVIIDWGDGTVETLTSGAWPTHTYAADGVYQITIRNATGTLPSIAFSSDESATVQKNLTLAVTSVDHFGGIIGGISPGFYASCRNTANLAYIDPRLPGCASLTNFSNAFNNSGISQPLDSLDLEFLTQTTSFTSAFNGCSKATGSTPKLPESAQSIGSIFQGCVNLDGVITNIPASVTTMIYSFYNCQKLQGTFPAIPSGVTSLAYTFYQCFTIGGALPNIPQGVTVLQNAFYQCRGATEFPETISTALTDVRNAFNSCRDLNTADNAAPELWDDTNYPSISQSAGCFYGLTNLSNYADIPEGWK